MQTHKKIYIFLFLKLIYLVMKSLKIYNQINYDQCILIYLE